MRLSSSGKRVLSHRRLGSGLPTAHIGFCGSDSDRHGSQPRIHGTGADSGHGVEDGRDDYGGDQTVLLRRLGPDLHETDGVDSGMSG